MTTLRAAVLGSPIGHSLSPVLHAAAYASLGLDGRFDAIEVDGEEALRAVLLRCDSEPGWVGLALTMPLKKLVLPMLDDITGTAAATGAANTVLFSRFRLSAAGDGGPAAAATGRQWWVGHNTDVLGIVGALREAGVDAVTQAVVLGGGATACSAVAALGRLGAARVRVVVRSVERAADVATTGRALGVPVDLVPWEQVQPELLEADGTVAVSTVPAQGADDVVRLVEQLDHVPGRVLLDVAYDPWPTPVAQAWERGGGTSVGGFGMLLHQAVDQVRLMTGRTPDLEAMRSAGLAALAARH
jgi:shikimate dehydrogenase